MGCVALSARSLPLHCPGDTAKVNAIIAQLRSGNLSLGERAAAAALQLLGAGEDDYYSVDSVADLRINIDSFSPLMFANTVFALAKASEAPGSPDWHTFAREFENISVRKGDYQGFPSIMYHSSDWIGDNISRGNVAELTENYSPVIARTKSLDEMTRYRGKFAALADSAVFERVRMTEMGFRTHRVPTLKKETVKRKDLTEDLRSGDMIILVPNRDGIDFYDIGILSVEDGVPYLIHLSPQSHTVVKESDSLARYMALVSKYFQGYRIIRLRE